jgi:large subunit ribosomal protein L35Ae
MKGTIVNYHIGIRTQASGECLIDFGQALPSLEIGKLIGRKLVWKIGEKTMIGKAISLHGKKGVIIARFRKGLPGQALGTTVDVL